MEEGFTSRSLTGELAVRVEVHPGLRVGGLLLARHDRLVETEVAGQLATAAVSGAEGGTTSGVGAVAVLDTRDNLYAPRRGVHGEVRAATFSPALGSDYRFHRTGIDVRRFQPVGGGGALAVRAYAARVWGQAPFYELPQIGAQGLLRGYLEGRFRDRAAAVAELELRVPVAGRFGAAFFAGVGGVGPTLLELPVPAELERTVGAGLRFGLNDGGVNLRVDYGVGREGGGLYLGIGEAF
jgi:outer membrane protein assembly factor BamA